MQLLARVRDSAAVFRTRLLEILRACNRPVPDWLLSAWQQALHVAEALAQRVTEVAGQSHVATEWTLRETAITLGGAAQLEVRGRIDLILTATPPLLPVPPNEAWIVDYKTGNRKALSAKALRAGDGLQLALYALALRELGTAQVGISLLTPSLDLVAPQLTLADLRAPEQQRLWRGLHRMQESGVFGMRGKLRDEFAFGGDYPLATLAIDETLLDEKWALTHPEFGEEEENS
jgi:RecB family exonuclease